MKDSFVTISHRRTTPYEAIDVQQALSAASRDAKTESRRVQKIDASSEKPNAWSKTVRSSASFSSQVTGKRVDASDLSTFLIVEIAGHGSGLTHLKETSLSVAQT